MKQISPSTLQTFNNELVKGLENLRDKHYILSNQIQEKETQKDELQDQITNLQAKLDDIKADLEQKYNLKQEYEHLILETETAYLKIVESSQALLEILHKQSTSLVHNKNR
jgi:Sjoegren syndrome nuclear autoantigen 1